MHGYLHLSPLMLSFLAYLVVTATASLARALPTNSLIPYLRTRRAVWSGIKASPFLPVSGCTTAQYTNITTAILHASYLAMAGKNAAADFTALPFSYFFRADQETATKVIAVFDNIIAAQLGQGPGASALCNDPASICGDTAPGEPQLLGYSLSIGSGGTPPPNFIPSVIMCPDGLELPPNLTPCTSTAGQKTIGELFLHELAHISEIVGVVINDIPKPDYHQSPRNVNANLLAGVDTTNDVDAYAYLGNWAWDYGLGDPSIWNGTGSCVPDVMDGNLDSVYMGPNGDWYWPG